jgi:hypothetical protein
MGEEGRLVRERRLMRMHYKAVTRVRGKRKNRRKGKDKFFGLEKECGHINHHVGGSVFCKDVNVRS